MKYIKVNNGIPENYSLEELFVDVPNATVYEHSALPSEALLRKYNVFPLITTPHKKLLEDEKAVETTPVYKDGEWYQTWEVQKLTQEEINIKINTYAESDIIPTQQVFSSEELRLSRLSICQDCSSYTSLKVCTECGCIMPLKVKFQNAVCPLNKW